jgi:signal transduction histidine kinase
MSQTLPVIYLVRHGGTAWSLRDQHGVLTNLPPIERGERHPRRLGKRRFAENDTLASGFAQVLESFPWAIVMEERSHLACEIHDTLTQGFAGILLHLEAAEWSDYSGSYFSCDCLACARELAQSGLEDARRIASANASYMTGASIPVDGGVLAD